MGPNTFCEDRGKIKFVIISHDFGRKGSATDVLFESTANKGEVEPVEADWQVSGMLAVTASWVDRQTKQQCEAVSFISMLFLNPAGTLLAVHAAHFLAVL